MIALARRSSLKCDPRSTRRGVSLIELLIVISIGSVIVGLCATTMHLILRVERDQALAVRTTMVLSRVRQLFTEDVHAGTGAEVATGEADQTQLRITMEGAGRIIYSADRHVLRREQFAGDGLEHRDDFHFPPGTEFRFEQEQTPRIVRLVIEIAAAVPSDLPEHDHRNEDKLRPPRTQTIEARLDRDRRFSRREP